MAINIFKRIKSIDIYGSKITLSHNGSTTFKTFFGGILTLITACFLVYYIYLIIENPKRLSTSVDSSSEAQTNSSQSNTQNSSSPGTPKDKLSPWISKRMTIPKHFLLLRGGEDFF